MIVPLHNHSMYSSLDGYSTPDEIATRIAQLGCSCCGLTDHGVVTGHLAFAKALSKRDIKPIFGCELYHGVKYDGFKGRENDQAHLIALAATDEGLRNLWRLVNTTSDEAHFRNVGRVFWEDLAKYSEGLIVTSACPQGLVPQGIIEDDHEALNRYLDIFGDNFFIEISTYPVEGSRDMQLINESLVAIAQERGLPLVYANDAHYAFPDQYPEHDLYLALQVGQSIDTPVDERTMWHPPDALAIIDEDTVRERLSYLPESAVDEAIANSVAIAERIDAHLPKVERHLPVFIPADCPWLESDSKALSAEELFEQLVESGIIERYGENASQSVWDRAIREAETCIDDGIHHYFLMGWDEVRAAKFLGVEMGPGRGSSAGSIVAYALGITDVDPLHYGLIFERFWNSGRTQGFPDIDSDFSRRGREKIIEYLKDRYGRDKVSAIGTTGYLKPKAVITRMAKGCGISFEEAEKLKEIVGQTTKIEILGPDQIGWNPDYEPGKKYYVKQDVGEQIDQWIAGSERKRRFVEICEKTCSRVEKYGIHASGIIVSDIPLDAYAPAYRRGGKHGVPATMFAMDEIDSLMLVKLDVLGLRTLDVLEFWRQDMAKQGIDIEWSGLDLQEHPQDMWKMLHDGFTAGIFQVEDRYGKQLCKRIEPRSVDDLLAINALNRPGPIQAKTPDEFIARRHGEHTIDYIHPRMRELMAPVLDPTYGLFVYQEQIIEYFNRLGYTLSEADSVRKMLGKKTPEKLAALREGTGEWEGRGYLEVAEAQGLPYEVADEVWHELEGFADYCFNKSHAAAYAIIGLRTLFAKYYAPAYFYAACIRSLDPSQDAEKRKAMIPLYVNECRRLGITIHPPDILRSHAHASVADNELYLGFGDIRGVGHSGEYIDYIRGEINVATPEAFKDSFEEFNKAFLAEQKRRRLDGDVEKVPSPKQQLRSNTIEALVQCGVWDSVEPREITMTRKQEIEQELLGAVITDNSEEVLDRNAEEIATCDSYEDLLMPWSELEKLFDFSESDKSVDFTVCGIVVGVQEKRAKASGKTFGVVTIEHGPHVIDFTVWNNKWRSHKFLFRIRNVGIFTLRHSPPNEYGENYTFIGGHQLT